MKDQFRAAMVGALAFIACQLLLAPASNSGVGWFLDSGAGIAITLGVLAAAAIFVQVLGRTFSLARPLWLAAGASLALVGYLVAMGPGNLYPMVIVMGMAMVIPTVLIAGYIGVVIAEFVRGG